MYLLYFWKLFLDGRNVFNCRRFNVVLNFDGLTGIIFGHEDRCESWELDRINVTDGLLELSRRVRLFLFKVDNWRVGVGVALHK